MKRNYVELIACTMSFAFAGLYFKEHYLVSPWGYTVMYSLFACAGTYAISILLKTIKLIIGGS